MPDEKFLDDLFEAARNEPAVRSLESVEQFVQAAGSGTGSSLIVQWLKQHKMNILISASSVMIATSVLLFSESQVSEPPLITEAQEIPVEQVEIVEIPQTEPEAVVENKNQPDTDSGIAIEEVRKEEEVSAEEVNDEEEMATGEVNANEEVSTEKDEELHPTNRSSTQLAIANPNPATQAKPVRNEQSSVPTKSVFKEHLIVLESMKGKVSADEFGQYLANNLSQLRHEFTTKTSKNRIRKFTLELDNGYKASLKMQVSGFEKLELHWEANEEGEIKDVWYRLDSKEKKEMDFSKSSKSSVKVKHTHEEF